VFSVLLGCGLGTYAASFMLRDIMGVCVTLYIDIIPHRGFSPCQPVQFFFFWQMLDLVFSNFTMKKLTFTVFRTCLLKMF
jgi:hypothetical protein